MAFIAAKEKMYDEGDVKFSFSEEAVLMTASFFISADFISRLVVHPLSYR
jgi:hypothetical protein